MRPSSWCDEAPVQLVRLRQVLRFPRGRRPPAQAVGLRARRIRTFHPVRESRSVLRSTGGGIRPSALFLGLAFGMGGTQVRRGERRPEVFLVRKDEGRHGGQSPPWDRLRVSPPSGLRGAACREHRHASGPLQETRERRSRDNLRFRRDGEPCRGGISRRGAAVPSFFREPLVGGPQTEESFGMEGPGRQAGVRQLGIHPRHRSYDEYM